MGRPLNPLRTAVRDGYYQADRGPYQSYAALERSSGGMMAACGEVDNPSVRAAVVAGDLDAFAALWPVHKPDLYRVLRRRGATHDDAEDILSLASIRALCGLGRFEERGATLGGWFNTICVNLLHTHRRSPSSARSLAIEPESLAISEECLWVGQPVDPADAAERSEARRLLRRALADLTPEQVQALRLRHLAGLSTRDTALHMDTSEVAVKSLLYRACRSLAKRPDLRNLVEGF